MADADVTGAELTAAVLVDGDLPVEGAPVAPVAEPDTGGRVLPGGEEEPPAVRPPPAGDDAGSPDVGGVER
ncbi:MULTISPECIES: hypothetical protein [unclassified Streptomyces]|uniref:hypothetical protein n=1 Tax=unclassified Streptomyces TaxID=2593676 RepID=UPI003D949ABE